MTPASGPDSVLVVQDHRPGEALRFDTEGTQEIVSAVRRRLAEILVTPVYEDSLGRAIQADALVGQANGFPTCARPLTIAQAYEDAAPTALLVRVAPRCEGERCEVAIDLTDVVPAFGEAMRSSLSLPVPREAVRVDDWIRAVRRAPERAIFPEPGSGRDVGADLGAREGAGPYVYMQAGDAMISVNTYARATRQRVPTAEAQQRLVDALVACEGARVDLRLGVETHVHIAIDGRGYFTGATATSEDPARARCAERAFEGLTTTCPLGRAPAEIELIACSYPAVAP